MIVIDVEEADEKGTVFSDAERVQVLQNLSSIPVSVFVSPLPAYALAVSLTAELAEGSNADVEIYPK